MAIHGFFLRKLETLARVWLGVGALGMLIHRNRNPLSMASWQVNMAGPLLCAAVFLWLWLKRRSSIEIA